MRGPNGLITRPPLTETIHQVKTHYKMESVIVLGAQCSLLNTISLAFSLTCSLSLSFCVPPPLALFLSPTCTHSHTLFPLLPLHFLRQSLWFQQAHMHGAGSTPPSISPLLLFCISIRVTNACLVPYWIRLMSLLTAFSLRQTCNEEEMRTGLLINRPTFHHACQVAGWTLCWCWCLKPVKYVRGVFVFMGERTRGLVLWVCYLTPWLFHLLNSLWPRGSVGSVAYWPG